MGRAARGEVGTRVGCSPSSGALRRRGEQRRERRRRCRGGAPVTRVEERRREREEIARGVGRSPRAISGATVGDRPAERAVARGERSAPPGELEIEQRRRASPSSSIAMFAGLRSACTTRERAARVGRLVQLRERAERGAYRALDPRRVERRRPFARRLEPIGERGEGDLLDPQPRSALVLARWRRGAA